MQCRTLRFIAAASTIPYMGSGWTEFGKALSGKWRARNVAGRRSEYFVPVLVFFLILSIGFPSIALVTLLRAPDPIVLDAAPVTSVIEEPKPRLLTVPQGEKKVLSLVPGRSAVTLKVGEIAGIEGFTRPGSRVDVLKTWVNESGALVTEPVAQAVRVLSLDGSLEIDAKPDSSSQWTLTLEVLPQDALRIRKAENVGKIHLALRAEEDTRIAAPLDAESIRTGAPGATSQGRYCAASPTGPVPLGTEKFPAGVRRIKGRPEGVTSNCTPPMYP